MLAYLFPRTLAGRCRSLVFAFFLFFACLRTRRDTLMTRFFASTISRERRRALVGERDGSRTIRIEQTRRVPFLHSLALSLQLLFFPSLDANACHENMKLIAESNRHLSPTHTLNVEKASRAYLPLPPNPSSLSITLLPSLINTTDRKGNPSVGTE